MSDYIRREAALESFGDAPMWTGYYEPHSFEVHMALTSIAKVIHETITQVPAADVEPVRRGNWNIRLADEMTLCLECSECGRRVDNIDLHYLLEAGEYGEACRKYPYCHCGAKMDLEVENDG